MNWRAINIDLDRFSAAWLPQSILNRPNKETIIRVHWLVVTIASYVLLFADKLLLPTDAIHAIVLFYVLAAAFLYFVDAKYFESHSIIGAIVVVDTLVLSFALIVTDQLESDFYLSYFLIIIIAGFWKDFRWSLGCALLFSLLYSGLLIFAETVTAHLLLRVPFILIASIFYSYFVHLLSHEHALRRQAENDARRDFLTAVPNRQAFEERIALEFERAQRYQRPLCLMMIDIDNFKLVNDTFGHAAGDLVLKSIAAELQRSLRSVDFVARVGGEEFVIILPETGVGAALDVGKRILATVRENPVETAQGMLSVTVSIGLSSGTTSDPRQMLLEADHALYLAKGSGKNRIEFHRMISGAAAERASISQVN